MYKHISAVLSGELFDIVINSLNSKYGRLKIISSITHGIFSPLSKYIIIFTIYSLYYLLYASSLL